MFIAAPLPEARAQKEVSVDLFAARSPLQSLVLRGPFTIASKFSASAAQRFALKCSGGQLCLHAVDASSSLPSNSRPMPLGARAVIASSAPQGIAIELPDGTNRHYRGSLLVVPEGTTVFSVRNKVDYSAYVTSVIGSESLPGTPAEALKAQSVLIQTLMMRYRPGDTLKDTTQTQAYCGADYERPEARRAFAATRTIRLMCQGKPVNIYFHAACSGGTSSSRLFAGKKPTAVCDTNVQCQFCKDSPFWRKKTARIPKALYLKHFPAGVPLVTASDSAMRPLTVRYADGRTETGYAYWLKLGQELGWDKVPGTRFKVQDKGTVVEISSTGAGHGIGLCQWGARGMADTGRTYRQILSYYFPGSCLVEK